MSRRAPLIGFLIADAVSLAGTRVSMIAIPWLVLTTTGSAAKTGLVALAELLPLVVVKALAGPQIDRVGARRVAITADVLSMLAIGLIPLLAAFGMLAFPALLLLVAVGGALRGAGDGAKSAIVPALSEHAAVPLERVTGLVGAIDRSAAFVGAALAGGLVALLGPATALAVDALSFGVCAAIFGWCTRSMRPARTEADAADRRTGPYLTELKAGWDFLRGDPVLVAMSAMLAVTNLLDTAFVAVLLPVWAVEHGYGIGVVSTYFAAWAAASTVGAVIAAWAGARLPRFRVYVIAFLIAGLPRFLMLGLGVPLWLVLVTCTVGGLASGFLNPILGAVIYERVPAAFMGRVTTLTTAASWSLLPLGGLLGGLLADAAGIGTALLVAGFAYLAATMLPLAVPAFRQFDRPSHRDEVDRVGGEARAVTADASGDPAAA